MDLPACAWCGLREGWKDGGTGEKGRRNVYEHEIPRLVSVEASHRACMSGQQGKAPYLYLPLLISVLRCRPVRLSILITKQFPLCRTNNE